MMSLVGDLQASVILLAVGGLLGGGLVWLVNYFTIRKLREETRKLKGETITRLHGYQAEYRRALKVLHDCLRAFLPVIESMESHRQELDSAREALSDSLYEAIPKYIELVDFHCEVFPNDIEGMSQLIEETVEEFRNWKRAIAAINNPKVLRCLDKEPLRFHTRTLRPLQRAVRKAPKSCEGRDLLVAEISRFVQVD